jgi:hypothetical protein
MFSLRNMMATAGPTTTPSAFIKEMGTTSVSVTEAG